MDTVSVQTDTRPARVQEAELRAFARRIDPVLRRAYTDRRVARLVQRPWRAKDLGKPASFWPPSIAAIVAIFLLPQVGIILWPAIPGPLFGLVTVGTLLVVDLWIWPWLRLGFCRFVLLRVESSGATSARCLAVPWPGSASRFGEASTAALGILTPGDLLVGVYGPWAKQPSALIHLTETGRQSISSLARQIQQTAVLPSASRRVQRLARAFDGHCANFRPTAPTTPLARPLRSSGSGGDDPWAEVVIDPVTKAELIALAEHFARGSTAASKGLLLYGPPGTGKTTIARAIAGTVGCAFHPLALPDLKQEWIGASAQRTKELWGKVLAEPRAVLFVDECESMFASRGRNTDYIREEILQTFLAAWDGFGSQSTVWVVGATNRRDMLDPAILSRFGEEVEIGLPSANARLEILTRELRRRGHSIALPAAAADLTQGMSGRDLATLAGRIVRSLGDGQSLTEEWLAALAGTWRKQGSATVDATARWETLVLDPRTMDELKTIAGMLQHADSLAKRGIAIPRGILLSGPPGTGKTQIARTLANETGLRLLATTTADLKDRYAGASGQKIQDLFARAREAAPSILFLDEIDVVAPARGGHTDPAAQEIVGQLLQEMDGAKASAQPVFVLAATNRPDQLDDAIRSRLPTRLEIPLPDEDGRRRLLAVMLATKPCEFDLEDVVPALAGRSAGVSGRDLRSWIEAAERKAITRALAASRPEDVTLIPEDFGETPNGSTS